MYESAGGKSQLIADVGEVPSDIINEQFASVRIL